MSVNNNNISTKSNNECSGCSACMAICPHDAIEMQSDIMGFYYPYVDAEKCINCGLCSTVCQFNNDYKTEDNYECPEIFAFRAVEKKELLRSQSGAAFYTIAKRLIIDKNFIVFGVGLDNRFLATHKASCTVDELDGLRGSKYIQSRIFECFRALENELKSGKKVLFTGTPCQVVGVKSFVPKQLKKNLFTIDIVCHGVPSPEAWIQYMRWVENKYHKKIFKVNFRDKSFGWHSCRETFEFSDGKKISRDSFRHFLMSDSHFCTRPSCAKCPFTNLRRVGDLTIGDFWGWEKFHKEFNDDKGISLLMVNSAKGEELFEIFKLDAILIKSDVNECLQPQLQHPISIDEHEQQLFVKLLDSGKFTRIMRHFADEGLKYRIYRIFKDITS